MEDRDTIVAIGLLTRTDLDRLGAGFSRLYPVDETPMFDELIRAIDEADQNRNRQRST